MPKGQPGSAKWFSVLSNLMGPDSHDVGFHHLDGQAVAIYFFSVGYVCKQGISHVPRAIPRLAVGSRGLKKSVAQLVELGFFIENVDHLGSYGIAHEGVLWRRGRIPDARPSIPNALRAAVYERDGFACVECQATEWLSLDHIFPYSKGGTDEVDNLRVLCRVCNSRKGARLDAS